MRILRNPIVWAVVLLGFLPAAPARARTGPRSPVAISRGCAGAILCRARWGALVAAGFDALQMRQEATAELTAARRLHAIPANWTGNFGFNDFFLYPADKSCQGTVTVSGFCAWLINHETPYIGGEPKPTKSTVLPARSGNNIPADHWIKNVGPVPNGDWQSSSPSLGHFHWGYYNGKMTGFESSTSDTYYPGWFRLDPTYVWSGASRSGVERDNMLIHGGRNSHDFWTTGTNGCIRMPASSTSTLASLWKRLTDNKGWGNGPDNFVHYSHP